MSQATMRSRPGGCRWLGLRSGRSPACKSSGRKVAWHLAVCAALVQFALGMSAGAEVHRHDFTERQRVFLAVQALSRAVMGGHPIDRAMLEPLIRETGREGVMQAVGTLSDKLKTELDRSVDLNRTGFTPLGAESSATGYTVESQFVLHTSGYSIRKRLDITVETVDGYPVIENANEVISTASAFVDSAISSGRLPLTDASQQRKVNRQAHGSLLTPAEIYNGSSRFNSNLSNAWFDGHDIFSRPYAVFCMEWDDGYLDWLDREFTMISDANWDRIIASSKCFDNDDHDWLQSVGGHGNGTLEFAFPSGFAFMNQKWMVGDGYNHRAMVYTMDNWETGEFTFDYEISDNFGIIADVASAYRPAGTLWPSMADFAVLDRDNGRVHVYDYQGNFEKSYFFPGSGFGCIDNPTSLAYARYDVDGYPFPAIYVADDGNKQVDVVSADISENYGHSLLDFPEDAHLSSVAVDPFSNVWIVDSYNGQVYMLSTNLTTVYAVIGEIGAADDQFYYPMRLATAEGWYCPPPPGGDVLEPIALGDLLVTERWGSQTGVRRYVIDCRIDSTWLQYQCQPNESSADYLHVEWSQVGYSTASMAIHHEGEQLWEWNEPDIILGPGLLSPGWGYQFPVDAPDGWYHYSLNINSLFGPTSLTVWDSMYVERHLCCDSGAYMYQFAAEDPSGELETWCYYPDTGLYWRCVVNAHDSCGGDSLTLFMVDQVPALMYTDTTQDPIPEFITRQANDEADTIFFKITSFPSGHNSGSLRELFRLRMTSVPEPFNDDSLYWWEFPWDSVSLHGNLYRKACETPCTPDCPPPNHGCPTLYVWDGSHYPLVNNILPQCESPEEAGYDVADYMILPPTAMADDGRYRLLLREDEQEVTRLDELTAMIVTSQPGSRIMVDSDGPTACRVTDELPPIRAVTPDGQEAGHLIEAGDDQAFTSLAAGHLDITYRLKPTEASLNLLGPTPPPKNMLKVADTGDAPPSKVTVSLRQDDGTFRTIHSLYPRRLTSAEPMDLGDLPPDDSLITIRLEWTRQISLDYLPLIAAAPAPCTVTPISMAKAVHSSRSVLLSALARDDGQTVTLEPGEQVELEFKAPQAPSNGQQQTIVIKAVGRYDRREVDHEADPSTIPGSYEFAQNYPNPFNPTTTFEFALPQSGRVSLEIYNLLGQKVATVIKRSYPVGRHTVAWDGATDRGTPIASGIYFARFTADAFTATKKLVVMK